MLVSQSIAQWRESARFCLDRRITPSEVSWDEDGSASLLFGAKVDAHDLPPREQSVPRHAAGLLRSVACHRDAARWSLFYTLLWRLTHGEPYLLQVTSDPLVAKLIHMHRAVRRAAHKMKAFVRFRCVQTDEGEEFVAWFDPAHRVAERVAPFFVDRFRSMRWSILTADACARWDCETLTISEGIERHRAPSADDSLEDLWRTYYAGIFNPARLNRQAMRAEMPARYWKNLPEAVLIEELARSAPSRVTEMIVRSQSRPEELTAEFDSAPLDHVSWDSVYDPGWREAKRRAGAAKRRAPEGIMLGHARVVAGVAGWTDPSLLVPGIFYPSDAQSAEARLRYYASQLPMVEVDATYYSMPSEDTSRRWVERTPPGFLFNIKAHSLMTGHPTNPARLPAWLRDDLPLRLRIASNVYAHHFSRDALDEVWRRFLSALQPLRRTRRLGAVMLQYPRWFTPSRASADALREARRRLQNWPASVEFRHRDWLSDRVAPRAFSLLKELELTYVAVDAPRGMESSVPPLFEVTTPSLAMFRFHGRRESTWEARNDEVAERYRYLYDQEQLVAWLPALERAIEQSMNVHLTFNNNKWNYAIANALEFVDLALERLSPADSGRSAPSERRPSGIEE